MQRLCSYCLKPIALNEPALELVMGFVHEKCYLERMRDSFKENLDKISHFPELLKSFQQTNNRMIVMIENIAAKGLHGKDHEEFCNEWVIINRNIMEFNMHWYLARSYMAQKNWIDRFLSSLKRYHFVTPRLPSESGKSNRLMGRILDTVTRYSIALIDESSVFQRRKTKTRPEEYVKELKNLSREFDKTTNAILLKASEDFQEYTGRLRKDYRLWYQQNTVKLSKYRLL